jgi:sialidase-1
MEAPMFRTLRPLGVSWATLVVLLLLTAPASADDNKPSFTTQKLYTAGHAGYRTYRIPAIAVAPGGVLLTAVAGRYDSASDWANVDLMLRRSTDGGKSWEDQQVLVNDGENTVDNPTFIVDAAQGETHLMYQINYARAYLKTSHDDGVTWSPPKEITSVFEEFRSRDGYDWKVLAMGPGHGIRLASGRLAVPVWLATDRSHRPSISATIYSDDRGKTWKAGETIVSTTEETPNPSEHELVEHADGRVMANIRTESKRHRRVIAFSHDGATGWTKPEFADALYEPICMASTARLPVAGNVEAQARGAKATTLLFSNPNSGPGAGPTGKQGSRERRNLTVRLSDDSGRTWPTSRVIAAGPSGYSDMAVAPDGTIYLLYEADRADPTGPFIPGSITLATFNRAWLLEGDPAN